MTFDVSADAYGRFMGRYSEQLAVPFADLADVRPGHRVLDVGSGPGALTAVLVQRLGSGAVAAVDPSPSFVAASRDRLPDVDVQQGTAEHLPYADDTFDRVLAQLVVQFMTDPVEGLRDMARVAVPGGVVAACVWDHGGGQGPLSLFWRAVRDLDHTSPGESERPGSQEGGLAELARAAGLQDVDSSS